MASPEVNLYPFANYRWNFKDPKIRRCYFQRERLARIQQLFPERGMRTTVEGVLLMWEHDHPHVIFLKNGHGYYELPGGRIRPGENEIEGLKRKLSDRLEDITLDDAPQPDWQIGECVSVWWRPDFGERMYPYCPPHIRTPKECRIMFLVHLPERKQLFVPANMSVAAVPLYELYGNVERFGQRLSALPHQLSRYKFNMIQSVN